MAIDQWVIGRFISVFLRYLDKNGPVRIGGIDKKNELDVPIWATPKRKDETSK